MTLAEIQDSPDYVNANEATKRAIFEQYSRDDKDFTTANAATQAAIREKFGVADPVETATGGDLAKTAVQTAAGSALSMGPTGLKELTQAGVQAVKPMAQAAIAGPIAAYRANPAKALAVDAVGAALTGGWPLGSAYQSIKSFPEKYKAAVEAGKEVSKFTSQGAPGVGGKPISIEPYQNLRDALRNAGSGYIYDDVMKTAHQAGGAGNNAVLSGLQNNQRFQTLLASNPEVASAFQAYRNAIPEVGAQTMRVAGPIARGVLKAAGPVGMALNMYDAAPYLEKARANAQPGDIGQRINQAQQMSRTGYNVGYQGPQLDAQQAQNVLQSGSARDIKYFGGQDNLREQMRRKAAARVSGPVAPGQQ